VRHSCTFATSCTTLPTTRMVKGLCTHNHRCQFYVCFDIISFVTVGYNSNFVAIPPKKRFMWRNEHGINYGVVNMNFGAKIPLCGEWWCGLVCVSLQHVAYLAQKHPTLFSLGGIRGYFKVLPINILLLGVHDLFLHGPIHLVIVKWPCQGHFLANHGNGLQDN
jgi:hypothetical protein